MTRYERTAIIHEAKNIARTRDREYPCQDFSRIQLCAYAEYAWDTWRLAFGVVFRQDLLQKLIYCYNSIFSKMGTVALLNELGIKIRSEEMDQ